MHVSLTNNLCQPESRSLAAAPGLFFLLMSFVGTVASSHSSFFLIHAHTQRPSLKGRTRRVCAPPCRPCAAAVLVQLRRGSSSLPACSLARSAQGASDTHSMKARLQPIATHSYPEDMGGTVGAAECTPSRWNAPECTPNSVRHSSRFPLRFEGCDETYGSLQFLLERLRDPWYLYW